MAVWNPQHGCRKVSSGCLNCYVCRRDAEFGKNSSVITRASNFALPVKRDREGIYKSQPGEGTVCTCITSNFFAEGVDEWRPEAQKMIRKRNNLHFVIITRQVCRFQVGPPRDWGEGYDNVAICCTCEDQNMADYRLPIFLNLSIRHRVIIHEPMLGRTGIRRYLATGLAEQTTRDGESDPKARICDYTWTLEIMQQCVEYDIPFWFKQTGTEFKKGNHIHHIERKGQMRRAEKAGVNYRYERNN